MKNINNKKNVIFYFFILCFVFLLSACKITPNEQAVTEKNNEQLEMLLQQTAESNDDIEKTVENKQNSQDAHDIWSFEKEYNGGSKLFVKTVIDTPFEENAPVAAVKEKPFTNDSCELIVKHLFPTESIFDYELTKETYEQEILEYKELLSKAKTNPDYFYFEDGSRKITFAIPDYDLNKPDTIEEELELIIEDLEKKYQTAPSIKNLNQTNYEMKDLQDSEQINLLIDTGDKYVDIDFVNWKNGIKGSEFFYATEGINSENSTIIKECIAPDLLIGNKEYEKSLAIADNFLKKIGVEYMEPEWVTEEADDTGRKSYTIRFTRVINGFQETNTADYLGTLAFAVDTEFFETYQSLWKWEYFEVTVKDGEISNAHWLNPSDIVIENDNVKIIPKEEAQEIFSKQMDRLMSSGSSEDDLQLGMLSDNKKIYINKAELGLTKILMANSEDYKLIPTWSFSGYDSERIFNNADETGALTCFVTINAVDGSVIDRGLMY